MKDNFFIQNISKEIFEKKYMINNEKNIEDVFKGIAKDISQNEKNKNKWYGLFYNEIKEKRLIPGGRILANSRPCSKIKNYNNCFTIDIEDSMESIFNALKEDAFISKQGGGVGFDISKLRPENDDLSVGGKSSGPISFLNIFNESAKVIMTGGQRRAAHIALMDISHPDIEKFITVKQGNNKLTQFNISVRITDKFINAVKNNLDWNLVFNNKIYKTVKATYLYDLLTKNAYEHNEPGIFNIDHVEEYNNGFYEIKLNCVNPCGELCMPAYSLCCLSSINLTQFVKNEFEDNSFFDYNLFKNTIKIGIRFLDNVLDITNYPIKKIEILSKKWRRIGLGITGIGDVLAMLKLKYGSNESLDIIKEIGETLRNESYITSCELAKEKGKFPKCNNEKIIQSNFIKKLPENIINNIKKYGLRNVGLNTIAPTGTTSLTIGNNCSSGIEPIFSLEYERTIRIDNNDENNKIEKVYDYAWLKYKEKFKNNIIPDYFVTTFDINVKSSIDLQSTFQKYIDHSISKTANLPNNYTYEQYKDLFMYAYDKKLKGFTSFNPNGSMKGILQIKKNNENYINNAIKRPEIINGDVYIVSIQKRQYFVVVGVLNDKVYEIFTGENYKNDGDIFISKNIKNGIIKKLKRGTYILINDNNEFNISNGHSDDKAAALTRQISLSLRHNVPIQFIVEQLMKNQGLINFSKAIARTLKKYIKDDTLVSGTECPNCNVKLIYRDGCIICPECGYSACN